VAFVRSEAGDHFQIEVAAHPEFHPDALSADVDLACFKRKIEAGATSALTQSFYNADAYFHFVESCSRFGVTLPIVQSVWDGQRLDEERRTAFTPPEDVRSDNSWTVRMSWPSSSRRAEGAYPASSDPRDLRRHDGTSTIPS
jgi:hypothetical protein